VLRLAEAADGFLARVRLPGGLISGGQLEALARLADELGDGRVTLTSRGNVQLRGLAADMAGSLTDGLWRAGLLPSLTHDRVRNVLASPLAGLDGGVDLTGIVRALDAALCARPRLAELPGRFLFAIDDGRGDVAALGADVVATVGPSGATVNGLAVRWTDDPGAANGDTCDAKATDAGAGVPGVPDAVDKGAHDAVAADAGGGVADSLRDAATATMLACAEAFLDLRAEYGGTAWRIADLPDGPGRVRAAVAARLGLAAAEGEPGTATAVRPGGLGLAADPREPRAGTAARPAGTGLSLAGREPGVPGAVRPVGLITRRPGGDGNESPRYVPDKGAGSAVLIAALGRLTAAQLTWIADQIAGGHARITPWRSVVLPGLPDAAGVLRDAAGLGFGVDEASPWLRVTACAGRPGCASALADVQADAGGFAARWPGRLVHVSGCGRHCGRPAATEVDVTATSEGYQVAGV
jgi:precorrin-3B synthase